MNPTLEIKVHRHNQEKAVFSEIAPQVVGELRLDKAAILESGMSGGKTSVTFFAVSETGGLLHHPNQRRYSKYAYVRHQGSGRELGRQPRTKHLERIIF